MEETVSPKAELTQLESIPIYLQQLSAAAQSSRSHAAGHNRHTPQKQCHT
jgi:hypothetical protein